MTPTRIPARMAFVASALVLSLSAAAATPNDYVMPYTSGTLSARKGIALVDSADFTQKAQYVPAATAVNNPRMLIGSTADGSGLHDARPFGMIWGQANRWRYASLRNGTAPANVQVSSENAANSACFSFVIYRNFATPNTAALFYQMPGTNGACDDEDDLIKWTSVNASAGTAPTTMAGFDSITLHPIYKTTGVLHTIYTLQGGNVLKISASDLTTLTTVAPGVSEFSVVGSLPDATAICLLDGAIMRIKPTGTLVAKPLRRPAAGYAIDQAWLHGTDVFFVESAISPSTAVQARIWRVAAGGTTAPVLMVALAQDAFINGFTTSRLVYTVGDESADHTLFTFPQDGVKGSVAPKKVHKATAPDALVVFTTHGANIFFDVRGTSFILEPPYVVNTAVAYVKSDLGAAVKEYGPGSVFVGGQLTDSGATALEETETYARLLLGRGATTGPAGSLSGHKLYSLNPATLAAGLLTDLPDNLIPLLATGIGPGSIGAVFNSNTAGLTTDVFAFDLLGLRYRLLTNGTAASEIPVF